MVETHPEKRLVGYARVSTYGQTLDSQLEQLRAAGCSSRNIYREKVTGARVDRRELSRMLGKLAPGDVVTVTRIDRLARSTFDLFGIVKRIVYAKAQFRSLAEPWADTGTSTGRFDAGGIGRAGGCGARSIRTCTIEGRSRAKVQRKHARRSSKLTDARGRYHATEVFVEPRMRRAVNCIGADTFTLGSRLSINACDYEATQVDLAASSKLNFLNRPRARLTIYKYYDSYNRS